MTNDKFELSAGEKISPLWLRLTAYLEDQLKLQRARNDANQSEFDTAIIRGDIKRLKAMLALGNDDRPQTE